MTTLTTYEILSPDFSGQGPFTGQQIEDLIKSGKLSGDQDVKKITNGKIINARYALLSANAADLPPSPPTKLKATIGIALTAGGLAIILFLVYSAESGERVRGKLFIIPGAMILIGAKMLLSYILRPRN